VVLAAALIPRPNLGALEPLNKATPHRGADHRGEGLAGRFRRVTDGPISGAFGVRRGNLGVVATPHHVPRRLEADGTRACRWLDLLEEGLLGHFGSRH
jgi:hypothetical protein